MDTNNNSFNTQEADEKKANKKVSSYPVTAWINKLKKENMEKDRIKWRIKMKKL